MRRIGNDLPAFLAREIVEQTADAGLPQKLVPRSDHGENRRLHRGSFGDCRSRELCHPAYHFRLDPPHHQRVPDQPDGGGRCQLPARQAFEHNLGISCNETYRRRHEGKQPMADAGSERAWRHQNKTAKLWQPIQSRGMNRDSTAQTLADDK